MRKILEVEVAGLAARACREPDDVAAMRLQLDRMRALHRGPRGLRGRRRRVPRAAGAQGARNEVLLTMLRARGRVAAGEPPGERGQAWQRAAGPRGNTNRYSAAWR